MTPINALISYLADHAKAYGIVYKQPEDEIAGINMAIGASVAGVRSMVATSGGGFSLMVEGLSLTGIMEVPLVIDLGMRVGPATGMPTWTEQGELLFAIHAGHGDFPRIVLAPGDAKEVYSTTIDAFNLADKYQIPVFVLTDKYLNESHWCVPKAHFQSPVTIDRGKLVKAEDLPTDGSFKRYDASVADGVSPRSVPGMAHGFYYANSYEHDEQGFMTEDAGKRVVMANKRLRKTKAITADVRPPTVYGDADAAITFVTWGSTKGPVIEAMKLLKLQGISTKLVHYTWMYPFPAEATKKLLSGGTVIDIEQNGSGQLAQLIRAQTGIELTRTMLKYDGRPFYPEEIVERYQKEFV
jgi:2-oxoglutarate ferredoxin oxidoreductase subunit alpha